MKTHNKEVIEYFKHRPDDLLILDLSKGHGWKELCSFLNLTITDINFPHAGKGNERLKRLAIKPEKKPAHGKYKKISLLIFYGLLLYSIFLTAYLLNL